MSALKAVGFKTHILILRISYWLAWAAPCLVVGEPQPEVLQSPCKLFKAPPQSHLILDCEFHKLCQAFMNFCMAGAGLLLRFWSLG